MKLMTFFAEVHIGNTETDRAFEIQAGDLAEALRLMTMYSVGANHANGTNIELRSVTAYRRKGTKYERIG